MKKIEERAELCQQYQEIYGGNFASAYKKGAEEQRNIDIDKACEWFRHQKEEIGISWFDDYEIRFRKAMEE